MADLQFPLLAQIGQRPESEPLLLMRQERFRPLLVKDAGRLVEVGERPLQLFLSLRRSDEPLPSGLLRDAVDRTNLAPGHTGPIGSDDGPVFGFLRRLPIRHRPVHRFQMINHTDNYRLSLASGQEDESDARIDGLEGGNE